MDEARDGNDESEWEYEYDENEVDTHYVILDLSCDRSIQLNSLFERNNTALEAENGTTDPLLLGPNEKTQDNNPLQFEGLGTATPQLHLNGKTYKLRWADGIGTDLIFRKPQPGIIDDDENPLVACTNLRLICDTSPEEPTETLDRAELLNEYKTMEKPLPLAVSTSSKVDTIAQAIFLQKFAAIKKAKGETDQIRLGVMPGKTKAYMRDGSPEVDAETGKKKRGRKRKARTALNELE